MYRFVRNTDIMMCLEDKMSEIMIGDFALRGHNGRQESTAQGLSPG